MTKTKYLIEESQITFYKDGEIKYITEEHPLTFLAVRDCLISNRDYDLDNHIDIKSLLKRAINSKVTALGIKEKLDYLESMNLPTQPLLSFIDKAPIEVLNDTDIIKTVGTLNVPLTWEGNIVLYTRASWIPHSNTLTDWFSKQFSPNKVLVAVQDQPITAGGFYWTMGVCPDTGLAYEVEVEPEHIMSIKAGEPSKLKQVKCISCLGESFNVDSQSSSPLVEFETQCNNLGEDYVVRRPYDISTAARLVASMYRDNLDLNAVEKTVRPRVMVGSC